MQLLVHTPDASVPYCQTACMAPQYDSSCSPALLQGFVACACDTKVSSVKGVWSIDARPIRTGDSPLPAARRRRLFSDVKSRRGREFSPAHMYTFHFWQHMLDCAKFKLDMGIASFDLARHLDGQPLQLMAQHSSSSGYIWRLLLHHQCQGGSMGSDL